MPNTDNEQLAIEVIAQAQSAKKELKELLSEITGVQNGIKGAIGEAKGLGKGLSGAFANIDFKGTRTATRQVESYLKASAKDLAKNLILKYEVNDKEAQTKIKELSQQLVDLQFEASKSKKTSGSQGIFGDGLEKTQKLLYDLIGETYDVRDASRAATSSWQEFYDTVRSSQKINIGEKGLEEVKYALGQWQHLDGFIKQKFSSKEGISLDSVWSEWDKGGKLSSLGESMGLDASNAANKLHIVIEAIKQYRTELDALPKAQKSVVEEQAFNDVLVTLNAVRDTASTMFLTASEKADAFRAKMDEVRFSLGNTGKDFATKGGNFNSIESIEKAIDGLQQKIYSLQTSAQTVDVGSEAFNKSAQKAVLYENQIESLKERLTALSTVPQFNPNVISQSALDAIERIVGGEEQLTQEVKETEIAYEELANEVQRVNAGSGISATAEVTRDMANVAEETRAKYSMLGDTIDYIKRNLGGFSSGLGAALKITVPKDEFLETQNLIENTKSRLGKLQEQMARGLATNKDFSRTTTFQKLKYDIEEASNSLKAYEADLDEMGTHTHRINWEGIGRSAQQAFSLVGSAIKKVIGHIRTLVKAIGTKISGAFANMRKQIGSVDLTSKGLVKTFLKTSNMLKLMVTRMALRGVINEAKEGFKDLLAFSEKTAASYNKIRNAIRYLADSLAALTAPILNASNTFSGLGNIIDYISDKVVDLVNKVNQLTSALLGHSTWIKAVKQTKDYTEAVKDAEKAAKGALQPFDELNNISINNGNDKNNGDSGSSGQYQELPIDQKWTDIAKWIKEQWEKSDFTELGSVLGGKLKNALDSIPWNDIKEKCKQIGSSIGTFINGFVEVPGLATSIGKTIGEAINSAITLFKSFVDVTHFDSIGTFIGEGIVGALATIDWGTLKSTAGDLGQKLGEGINALLDTNVLSAIGMSVGNLLRTGINLWYEFVGEDGLDFSKLGQKIRDGINAFLDTMGEKDLDNLNGWQKLGTAISNSITGFLTTANIVIGDQDTLDKITKSISDFIDSIKWQDIKDGITKLGRNVVKAIEAVLKGIFTSETFKTDGLAMTIDAANLALMLTSGALLAQSAKTLIGGAIGNPVVTAEVGLALIVGIASWKIGNKVYENLTGEEVGMTIGEQISYIIGSFKKPKEVLIAVKLMLSDNDNQTLEKIDKIFFGGLPTITANIIGGKSFVETLSDLKNIQSAAKNPIRYTLNFVTGNALSKRITEWINGKPQEVKIKISETAQKVAETLKKIFDIVKGLVAFAKSPIKFTMGFDVGGASGLPFVQSAIDKIKGLKKEDITKEANVSIKTSATDNGQPVSFNSLADSGSKVNNLADSWKNLKSAGGEANLNANANWAEGTKEKLESNLGELNLKATATVENIKWEAGQTSQQVVDKNGKSHTIYKALGGLFKNGKWKPIQKYAAGGVPNRGEMFVAREKGAELVGRIGGGTGVMNNDQIVASVSAGVYKAVVAAMANAPTSQTNVTLQGDVAKLFRVVRSEGLDYQRRTGNPVFP